MWRSRGTPTPATQRTWAVVLLAALFIPIVAGCLTPAGDGSGRMLNDDTRAAVDVSDVSRIVATSHDLVEVLFLLGHGHRLVAVPDWIEHPKGPHPAGIDGLERIGRPHVISAEEVLSVDATLVLEKDHPLQPTSLATTLRNAGVPVFVFDNTEDLDNVRHTFERVASILEHVDPEAPAKAQAQWAALRARFDAVEATVAGSTAPTPRAMYQLPVGFVAGMGTSSDILLRLAGAENAARTLGIDGYRQISQEALVSVDVERVAATTSGGYAPPHAFFNDLGYRGSTAAALQPETLRPVDPATTALVGPRFIEGVEAIAAWLHPAAFRLIAPSIDSNVTATGDGIRLKLDASASTVTDGPASFRFLAGDGSPAQDDAEGRFSHHYTEPGPFTARILVIDAEGRLHEHRIHVES